MAISLRTAGTYLYGQGNLTPTIPTYSAGDMMVCFCGVKPYSATVTIDQGWTDLGYSTDGTVAPGLDTGSMHCHAFYKIASASETNPTLTISTTDVQCAVIMVFQRSAGTAWAISASGGGMGTASTSFAANAAVNFGVQSGDMAVGYIALRSDAALMSAEAFSAVGTTMAAVTESPADTGSTLGNDMNFGGGYGLCSSGCSIAVPRYTATLAASHTGTMMMAKLREATTTATTTFLGLVASTADATTGWSGLTTLSTTMKIEGTGCVSTEIQNSTALDCYFTITAIDLTGKNCQLYFWGMNQRWEIMDTQANGGIRLYAYGATAGYWNVAGSDNYGFDDPAGWRCFTVDIDRACTSGTPTKTALTRIGCSFKQNAAQSAGNTTHFGDTVKYGLGLKLTGGTSGAKASFDTVATAEAVTTNRWGIMRSSQGTRIFVGRLQIGDDYDNGADAYFADTNEIIIFADEWVSSSLYALDIQGTSATTTSVTLGTKVGSGDSAVGSGGCSVVAANASYPWKLSVSSGADTVGLYGCSFSGMASGNTMTSAVDAAGCVFDKGGQIQVSIATIVNSTFSNTTETTLGAILLPSGDTHNVRNCSFNNNARAIEINTAGTYTFNALNFSGNTYDIQNSSTGAVIINCTNGSNPTTYINTGGGTTTINNAVTIAITVKDEAGSNIQNARVSVETLNAVAMAGAVADDGGSLTDETTAANNATTNDMSLVANAGAIVVNDAYYFGSAEPFSKLRINVGQNGVGSWAVTWEYYDQTTGWTDLSSYGLNDGTNSFKAGTGNREVAFNPQSGTAPAKNWVTTTVSGINAYWVRARITTGDASPTTRAKGTQSWIFQQIMNELTDVNGLASESYNYTGVTDVYVKIRKSSTGATKYIPANTTQTITTGGLSLSWIMITDAIAAP